MYTGSRGTDCCGVRSLLEELLIPWAETDGQEHGGALKKGPSTKDRQWESEEKNQGPTWQKSGTLLEPSEGAWACHQAL